MVTLVVLASLSPGVLLWLGGALTLVALSVSLLAGLVYHLRLRAVIGRAGRRPPLWWWAPSRFHAALDERDKTWVMGWFRAGALSFGFCGLGLFIVAGAIVKAFLISR